MQWLTHEVVNQAPPLQDFNLFATDPALQDALRNGIGERRRVELNRLGDRLGSADVLELAELANRHAPELRAFDRNGNRIDQIAFHPAWHALLALLRQHGMHAAAWLEPEPAAHLTRAAGYY